MCCSARRVGSISSAGADHNHSSLSSTPGWLRPASTGIVRIALLRHTLCHTTLTHTIVMARFPSSAEAMRYRADGDGNDQVWSVAPKTAFTQRSTAFLISSSSAPGITRTAVSNRSLYSSAEEVSRNQRLWKATFSYNSSLRVLTTSWPPTISGGALAMRQRFLLMPNKH